MIDPYKGLSGKHDFRLELWIIKFLFIVGGPKESIELFLSCRNLKDLDVIGKSDPWCIVFIKNDKRSDWTYVGKTEIVKESLNPDWAKSFVIDYYFEKNQEIRFEVYDEDDSRREEQGNHTTTVSALIGAKNQTYAGDLTQAKKSGNRGTIIVKTDSVKDSNKWAILTVQVRDLIPMQNCLWGVSDDPFLIIKRCHTMDQEENVDAVKVHETDPQNENTSPLWHIKDLRIQSLCNSDPNLPILFEVWNYNSDGNHKKYGSIQTTLQGLQTKQQKTYTIADHENLASGTMDFTQFLVIEKPSMMDYLRSGWLISLSVAIDFTASNGETSDPGSLHYIDPNNLNKMTSYEEAIFHVGRILEPYDSNMLFPVFGFGAIPRYMGVNDISHWFHLNGSENPEVYGIKGVLDAYRNAIFSGIRLYGPTNFSPCLQAIMGYIKGRLHTTEYIVMLYITDGAITDMDETIDSIVEASYLPISIIIVGVGDSNFSKMEKLDSDKHILKNSAGHSAARDIVQFVEFNDFIDDITLLPEEVLREVPNQFVAYMSKNNIKAQPTDHIPANEVIRI